jgi:hypothetical protein
MVAANEIGWGNYRQYEGPFYRGRHGYKLPNEPTEPDRILAVITATEGGHFDAWNGYDVCGWTSGLIQWCERGQYSVSDMLGDVADLDRGLLHSVDEYCTPNHLTFKKNSKGRWRFFYDKTGEVDTQQEQHRLFYIYGDGTKGSWTAETKAYAKQWAASISTVWENSTAQVLQARYTTQRLGGFMLPYARTVFGARPSTEVAAAAYAAYLSFAANNPTWANTSLQKAIAQNPHIPAWSRDWFVAVLRELTFSPQVAIYPHRYNAIRPVLEKLYNLQLPDFAEELKVWSQVTKIPAGIDTKKLQNALISLGYDLGPKGADGVYGKKTTEAVLTLEQTSGLVPVENQDGVVDVYTWPALQGALQARGLPALA